MHRLRVQLVVMCGESPARIFRSVLLVDWPVHDFGGLCGTRGLEVQILDSAGRSERREVKIMYKVKPDLMVPGSQPEPKDSFSYQLKCDDAQLMSVQVMKFLKVRRDKTVADADDPNRIIDPSNFAPKPEPAKVEEPRAPKHAAGHRAPEPAEEPRAPKHADEAKQGNLGEGAGLEALAAQCKSSVFLDASKTKGSLQILAGAKVWSGGAGLCEQRSTAETAAYEYTSCSRIWEM